MRLPGMKSRDDGFKDMSEFYIYFFKTQPCDVKRTHEWKNCCFVHDGEKARRRNPRVYSYLPDPCSEFMQKGSCPKGDACPLAHGVFETWLHPAKFCTVMCTEGAACKRKVCWFAHSPVELRAPTAPQPPPPGPQHPAVKHDGRNLCSSMPPPAPEVQPYPASSSTTFGSAGVRGRSASYSGGSSDTTNLYGNAASSSSSSSACSGSSNSYYLHNSDDKSPISAGSRVNVVDFGLPPMPHSPLQMSPHNLPAAGSALGVDVLLGAVGPVSSLPSTLCRLPPDIAASSQLLQQVQQQHDLQRLQQLQQELHQQQVSAGLSAPLSGLQLGGVPDSSAAVPVSVVPMLANLCGGDGMMLDSSCINPLTGLLTNLEQQAWQAQLQAAHTQAAAAAASNNLQTMLSALGGLSSEQASGGGVCNCPAALQHLRRLNVGSTAGAAFHPAMM